MKKITLLFFTLFMGFTTLFPFTASAEDKQVIKIGVKPPYDQALEVANEKLKDSAYELEIIPLQEAVQINEATEDGTLDANFNQHEIYMEQFNDSRDGNLVRVGDKLFLQVIGLFSSKYESLDEIQQGDQITIQNDAVNRDRALKILEDSGLIKLDEIPEGELYTLLDIAENRLELNFNEVPHEQLVRMIDDTDAVILGADKAHLAGYYAEDALATYDRKDNEDYAIVLVVKDGNQDSDWAKALYDALTTKEFADKIYELTGGGWQAMFEVKE